MLKNAWNSSCFVLIACPNQCSTVNRKNCVAISIKQQNNESEVEREETKIFVRNFKCERIR